MDINKFFQSKAFSGLIFGIAIFAILLLVFKIGTIVGVRKADFSCRWSDNYQRNFAGPRGRMPEGFGDRDFIGPSGTAGQIIKVDAPTIIIRSRENIEKIVLVDDKTVIQRLRETIKPVDLKVDENVIVIGEPNNNGQVAAKFIRVLPDMPMGPVLNVFPNH